MYYNAQVAQEARRFLRVLVASPSDTTEERAKLNQVIPELNKLHGAMEGFNLEGLLWETDSYPGMGVDAQDVLNHQLADYDIFVGIMNTRFGTPTHRCDSGTEEEFNRALDRYLSHPSDIRILFYFRDAVVRLFDLDMEQAWRVREFRARIQRQGLLVGEYATPEEFRVKVQKDLLLTVRELLRPASGLPATPATPVLPLPVDCGAWNAATRVGAPQGASYKPIHIAQVRLPLRLTGVFQSRSPYFRFGFKLMGVRGHPLSPGSIQTEDKNVLVHIGKNVDSTTLFLTKYRNGLRMGPNTSLLEYEDCQPLPMQLAIETDFSVSLSIDGSSAYEGYIDAETKGRLLLLAWGDEYDYDIEFSQITLYGG